MPVIDIKDIRGQFLFMFFWRSKNYRVLSVKNPDDVILAVNKAYIDMTPRTITGFGLANDKLSKKVIATSEYKNLIKLKEDSISDLKKCLANKIVEEVFLKNTFNDIAHKELCDLFLDEFKKIIGKLNTEIDNVKSAVLNTSDLKKIDINKITYGKAQKIINMSMKYLYFFDDALDFEQTVFENCHMAIDEYIMDTLDGYGIARTCAKWSNFDEDKYKEYQGEIKKYCSKNLNGKNKSPFFAEFDFWINGHN